MIRDPSRGKAQAQSNDVAPLRGRHELRSFYTEVTRPPLASGAAIPSASATTGRGDV